MQFSKLATILSTAALAAAANTITFVSQDSTSRNIYFTANPGSATIETVTVAGGEKVIVNIPQAWQGNWYSVSQGAANVPGMLGEVAFNSWGGITFFDVSAIVNPNDTNGVKKIYPASATASALKVTSGVASTLLYSGCDNFAGCTNAYYHPDDVQTKATQETDLICTLGTSLTSVREVEEPDLSSPVFSRDWVLGKWTPTAAN